MKTFVESLFVLGLLAPPLAVAAMLLVVALGRPRPPVGQVPSAHAA